MRAILDTLRRGLEARELGRAPRLHAVALVRRLSASSDITEVDDVPRFGAGVEYLAQRVEEPEASIEGIARAWGVEPWEAMAMLSTLREATRYRAYVGEWIRAGSPLPAEEIAPEVEPEWPGANEPWLESTMPEQDEPEYDLPLPLEGQAAPSAEFTVSEELPAFQPTRWHASFALYKWQMDAACAWEENQGRGIMQVVTGAGKTALAVALYGRLLDRAAARGGEIQAIVIVPRIDLARQWAMEFRRLLDLRGLRVGQYHSEQKCLPAHQDVLIITQDSARIQLPRMRFDRPVLLVADECHRLGAPAASRILARDFTWTLGLSATPERAGDLAFEEVLVPRLGPVVWKYGYQEAVRDGIIARFSVARVRIALNPGEQVQYEGLTEAMIRLLDQLKRTYPVLYRSPGRTFWQKMGRLKKDHPQDSRFEALTATLSERRAIAHFAEEKYAVIAHLAEQVTPPRKVLCFHERIEAAEKLHSLCVTAGRDSTIYHSQIPGPERQANLKRFREGKSSWLIACKSLDEGLDIPAVDTIIVAAGTKSARQLIQRLGRALRRKEHDRSAAVILIEVAGVDDDILDQEGLDDLREAAQEVVSLDLRDVAQWLRTVQPTSSTMAPVKTPRITRSREKRDQGRSSSERPLGGMRGLLNSLRQSWTGSSGTHSYYDRDSSPE